MDSTSPLTPAERFAQIIDGLLATLRTLRLGPLLAGPLGFVVWWRIRRMQWRFIAIMERVRAGPPSSPYAKVASGDRPKGLRTTCSGTAVAGAPRRDAADRPEAAPRLRTLSDQVPREFGWLLKQVSEPYQVVIWRDKLEQLLADPEMVALLAAVPQFGRVVRPCCRMLGTKPPDVIVLPRGPRKPRPAPERAPPDKRAEDPRPPPMGSRRWWSMPKWQRDWDIAEWEKEHGKKWR